MKREYSKPTNEQNTNSIQTAYKQHTPIGHHHIAVGYIRTSTKKQKLSPTVQEENMRAWCNLHNVKLADTFKDIAISGSAPLNKRPGLLAAIHSLNHHNAGILLVDYRDRLARGVDLADEIEDIISNNGAIVVSVSDGVGTPAWKMAKQILNMVKEYVQSNICHPSK